MADDTSNKPAVVDSRQAGFNPEVEASHAAAATPKTPAAAAPAPAPAPLTEGEKLRAYLEAIALHLGNPPILQKLLAELYPPVKS